MKNGSRITWPQGTSLTGICMRTERDTLLTLLVDLSKKYCTESRAEFLNGTMLIREATDEIQMLRQNLRLVGGDHFAVILDCLDDNDFWKLAFILSAETQYWKHSVDHVQM